MTTNTNQSVQKDMEAIIKKEKINANDMIWVAYMQDKKIYIEKEESE